MISWGQRRWTNLGRGPSPWGCSSSLIGEMCIWTHWMAGKLADLLSRAGLQSKMNSRTLWSANRAGKLQLLITAWMCSAVGVGCPASCSPGGDLLSLWRGCVVRSSRVSRELWETPLGRWVSANNQGVNANRKPKVYMEKTAQRWPSGHCVPER